MATWRFLWVLLNYPGELFRGKVIKRLIVSYYPGLFTWGISWDPKWQGTRRMKKMNICAILWLQHLQPKIDLNPLPCIWKEVQCAHWCFSKFPGVRVVPMVIVAPTPSLSPIHLNWFSPIPPPRVRLDSRTHTWVNQQVVSSHQRLVQQWPCWVIAVKGGWGGEGGSSGEKTFLFRENHRRKCSSLP